MKALSARWALLPVLAVLGAAAVTKPAELPEMPIAVVITDEAAGDAPSRALVDELQTRFGFTNERTAVLRGREATHAAWDQALRRLSAETQGRRLDVFVYVSLPVREERGTAVFRPADATRGEPWRWIPRGEIFDWVSSMQVRSALIVHPGCRGEPGTAAIEESIGSKTGTLPALALMNFCAGAGDLGESTPQERGRFTAAFVDALRKTKGVFGVDDLVTELRAGSRGATVTATVLTGQQSDGFCFLPRPRELGVASPTTNSPDPSTAQQQVQAIAVHQDSVPPERERELVKQLENVARSEDLTPDVRRSAIDALGRGSGAGTESALVAIAKDPNADAFVRRSAVAELVGQKDVVSLRALAEVPEADIRVAAIRGGGRLLDSAAADMWIRTAASGNESQVRVAAIQSLSGLKREDDRQFFRSLLADPESPPSVRGEALAALERIQVDLADLPILIALVEKEPEVSVRRAATFAMGHPRPGAAPEPKVEEALLNVLSDRDDTIRHAAATAIGELRIKKARPELESITKEKGRPDWVRVAAIDALRQIGDPGSIDILVAASRDESSRNVRRAATTALGAIGGEDAGEAIVKRLDDGDDWVRDEALRAGLRVLPVPSKAARGRLEDRRPFVRVAAVKIVGRAAQSEDCDVLVRRLTDDEPTVRTAAWEALALMTAPESVGQVAKLLDSSKPIERAGAAQVLARSKTLEAGQWLAAEALDADSPARSIAIVALGTRAYETAPRETVGVASFDLAESDAILRTTLESLARGSDEAARRDAATALGEVGKEPRLRDWAVTELEHLTNSTTAGVKNTASDSLRSVGRDSWRTKR